MILKNTKGVCFINITIVDSRCGAGKSSYAIQMMRKNTSKKYIYITPFLDEIQRIKNECSNRYFYEPNEKLGKGSKLRHFNELLSDGDNIASTHSLFQNINKDTIEALIKNKYTLILDETMNILEEMKVSKSDLNYLMELNVITVDDKTKKITWHDENYDDKFGAFSELKNNCTFGDMYLITDKVCYWIFPIEIFKYFEEIYIMTYMHKGQIQTYYLDMHNIKYEIKSVRKCGSTGVGTRETMRYELINYCDPNRSKYKELINIYDGKLNDVERKITDFSKTYYVNAKAGKVEQKESIELLKRNLYNYFKCIINGKSDDNMWSVFKDFKSLIKGKGYTKGFVECNIRATNKYKNKKNLAYCCNFYLNPMQKRLFKYNNIEINEDYYALDKLLQWIFRSQLRDNKPINIYLPSSRMRRLLTQWIDYDM